MWVTYDANGVYLSVTNLCVGRTSSVPGKTLIYAFDKDVVYGLRALGDVPFFDLSSGLPGAPANLVSVMPGRPQGSAEGDRAAAFFAAQNTATPSGKDDAYAVLGLSIIMITRTYNLPDAGGAVRINPKICLANIFKNQAMLYYKDGAATRPSPPYIPGRQPPYVFSGADQGPALYSGLWTHVYAAALHATGSDSAMWLSTRALGGKGCQAAGPSDPSACNAGLWYGMVSLIEGSVIFNPRLYNEDVVMNTQLSVMFPALAVNSNGSVLIQFAYSSGDDSEEGVLDDNGDPICTYAGVASLGISAEVGAGSPLLIKRDGKGTVQLRPMLAGQEPPLSFGRVSASDTVELPSGKRRMYTAIGYAFNAPDFFGPGPLDESLGYNNIGNYITVTNEIFA